MKAVRRTAQDWLDRPMTSWHLIIGIFLLLLAFGLLMVLSASSISSFHKTGEPFATFQTQAMFAVIGMFAFVAAYRLSIRVMRSFSLLAVAVAILLLAVVLVIGNKGYGAQSWITVGPFNLQPSELAKLALLIWMGHVLAARRNTLRSLRALLFPVVPVFLVMVVLIMKQPDLGTTITLGIIFIAVLWFGGAPLWVFGLLVTLAAGAGVFLATSVGYRNERVLAWLHPSTVPDYAVYQINQSLFGLGHGGLFGTGLGQAVSKTGWLPNADSDFIFAVIGEELGLVGAGLVVVMFALLAYTGLRIARRNVDPFVKITASAATVWLVGQAAVNIGYVIGLLPVTGLTLPMISRGGTSLVVTMTVFGMLANFARREPQAAAALQSQGPGRLASFLGMGMHPPKPPKARRTRQPRPPRAAKPRPAPAGEQRPVRAGAQRRSAAPPVVPAKSRRRAAASAPASSGAGRGRAPVGPPPLRRSAAPDQAGQATRTTRSAPPARWGEPGATDREGRRFVEPVRPWPAEPGPRTPPAPAGTGRGAFFGRGPTPRDVVPRSATPRAATPRAATPRAATPRGATPRAGSPRTDGRPRTVRP